MSAPSPFPSDQTQDTFDPRRSARHALALQVRGLIDLMVDTEADETTLGEAAETIRALNDRINGFGHHSPLDGFAESAVAGEEMSQRFDMFGAMPVIFDRSPVMGLSNPVAPPLALCTDNAAIIAWAGLERMALAGFTPDPFDFVARPRWPLDPDAAPARGAGVKA